MTAPTVGTPGAADPTSGTATGTTRSPGAPAAVSNGTLLMGVICVGSAVNPGDTAPNWTRKYNSNAVAPGLPVIAVLYRRNTGGAEPTPYSWSTGSGVGQSSAQVWPIENELASGDPFHSSSDFQRATATANLPTVSVSSVPAGSTLFYVAASGSARTLTTGPSIGGTPMTRLTPTGAQLWHLFKFENYAGGSPSVSGLIVSGGNSSQVAGMWAVLPQADTATGSATGSWSAAGTASGVGGPHVGSGSGNANFFGTAEGPNNVTEYVEDWADLASVDDTGVQVSGNKLYASGSTSPRGYLWVNDFPPTGIWRYQQVIYCQGGSTTPAPVIKLGVTTNPSPTTIADTDPYSLGWQIQFSTRARSSFKGGNLSSVTILDEEIAGLSPGTTTTSYLFTIDADEHFISFALKRVDVMQDVAVFRVARADLADAGREVTAIYAYITDGRTTSGSSLSPFIYQEGSLQPTATKVVGGQTIEGYAQHVIATAEDTGSVRDWYFALPPSYKPNSPLLIHCPQSLTGDGDDFWTDSRMDGVTTALTNAGFVLASSSDVADRFANEVDVQNFNSVKQWFFDHFGSDRDVFLFGTSMGTLSDIVLVARGLIDARAVATIGYAGGQFWIWYNVTTKRQALRDAFGFTGTPTDPELHDYFEGYDPMYDYAGDTDFAGKGFRFYTSDSDPTTPSSLSDTISGIVQAAGASEYTVVRASGGHLDPSQYQPTDLVDFYLRNASENLGTATGSWNAPGTASGLRASRGTTTDSWSVSGLGIGGNAKVGSATGSWSASGTADGKRVPKGTASGGTWSASGSAVGSIAKVGSATGSWGVAGTSAGTAQHRGTSTGSWDASGAGTGTAQRAGSTTGSWSASGTASGKRVPQGQTSAGVWSASGAAQGFSGGSGVGSGDWAAEGDGTGEKDPFGTTTGSWNAAGSAVGGASRQGTATGSWAASGTASGKQVPQGVAEGSWAASGTGTGKRTPKGSTVTSWAAPGTASGGIPKQGFASGAWATAGSSTGTKPQKGSVSGGFTMHGTASGGAGTRFGYAVGFWSVSGTARSKLPVPCDPVATIVPKRSFALIVCDAEGDAMIDSEMSTGDTEPGLELLLTAADPVDIESAQSVRIIGTMKKSGLEMFDRAPTEAVSNPDGTSTVRMDWQPGDTRVPGLMDIEVEATWAPDRIQTFPAENYVKLRMDADA